MSKATHDQKAAALGAVREAMPSAPAERQLELVPLRPSLRESDRERAEASLRADRRGRPPGATNLAGREVLKFVRQVMGDPLMESARWAMHTPESLALELGCSKADAFDRLERIRSDLRPYFYAKQAPVDGDGNVVVPGLTIAFGGQTAGQPGAVSGGDPPWLYQGGPVVQHEQNQSLSGSQDPMSHADGAGEIGKTNDNSGLDQSGG